MKLLDFLIWLHNCKNREVNIRLSIVSSYPVGGLSLRYEMRQASVSWHSAYVGPGFIREMIGRLAG